MAELLAGLPVIEIRPGMQVVFEAVDPSTGATVGGVNVGPVRLSVERVPPPDETTQAALEPFAYVAAGGGNGANPP